MPKKLFVKGQTKAGPGRPKGSKDLSYLTLEHWHEELKKDWPKLKPAQRAKLSAQLMQMLTNKMKSMPSNPADSVRNVEESMKILETIEKGKESEEVQKNEVLGPIPAPPQNVGNDDGSKDLA